MDAQDLKGLAVITVAEADRLGRVEDVLFRSAPLQAVAIRLATAEGSRIVALGRIRSIGKDAITTDTERDASDGEAELRHEDLRGLDELTKLKVVDHSGGYLGHVARLDLDPATGDVKSVEVRKGEVMGLGGETETIPRDRIVAVGPELITVQDRADSGPDVTTTDPIGRSG